MASDIPGSAPPNTHYTQGVHWNDAVHMNQQTDDIYALATDFGFMEATELTIAAGVVTRAANAGNYFTIDTEADAASDDLDTINGGDEALVIIIRPEHDDRTIVVKHDVGNISCVAQADITLDDIEDFAILIYDAGLTKWLAMGASAAGDVATDVIWDAKGDLAGGTGADTAQKLTVGAADTVLTADAGETTGMKWALPEISKDTTPQLGGDLDLNDKNIVLKFEPTADDTASGLIITATVDSNSTGIGCPLFMAADGHLDEADADSSATAPCVALALEANTGSKKILLHGVMRNDGWNWTTGAGTAGLVYLSTTVGELTQVKPSGVDDVIQPVGWALSDDVLYFCPSMMYFTHTG